jgi:hypothetical protein
VLPSIASPEPARPTAGALRDNVQSWCPPHLASTIQIAGERVALPWRVVRAIQTARNIGLGDLVLELHRHGQVLADDGGLTVIASSR